MIWRAVNAACGVSKGRRFGAHVDADGCIGAVNLEWVALKLE